MYADSAPRWLPTLRPSQPTWLSVRQKEMAAIVRIHHRHLLLLSPRADTHFTAPQGVEDWVDLGTAVRVCSPCPRLYIAVAVVINNCQRWESNLGPLTLQSGMLPLYHCDTAVTAGLAESNGSLQSGWLIVSCGLTICTPRLAPGPTFVNKYGKPLPVTM